MYTVVGAMGYAPRVLRASVQSVIERVDAFRVQNPDGVVATDGDGTLWSGDIGDDFYFAALDSGEITSVALEAMQNEARTFGISAYGDTRDARDARSVGRALYEAYEAGRYSEERLYELMAYCVAGWSRSKVEEFARKVLEQHGLAQRFHQETITTLRELGRRGIDIFVVSASPNIVVETAAHLGGIGRANVIAAKQKFVDDIAIPEVERPIPYGAGKVQNLRARIGDRPLYAAFGDNVFDVPLLQNAHVAVAIRPKPRLLERIGEVPGIVELEPALEPAN